MEKYTRDDIAEFPEDIGKTAETPAAEYLFTVRDDDLRRLPPEDQSQVFHRTVAQLLFLMTRSRHDARTALAFPTTRVKDPNKDDRAKLCRVLQ